MYVLKRREAEDVEWWENSQKCQEELRKVAKDALGEEMAEKYFVSITETEIHCGLKENSNKVVVMERLLGNIKEQHHLHRHVIDMKDGAVDEMAQEQLKALREEKMQAGLIMLQFNYSKDKDKEVNGIIMLW